MDNLGHAIYMACFALLFVFAASISIYLYTTLNTYLNDASNFTNISYRAEGVSNEDLSNFKRDITSAEIYITLHNMEQMHVGKLTVAGKSVKPADVRARNSNYDNIVSKINAGTLFSYSSSGDEVEYKYR